MKGYAPAAREDAAYRMEWGRLGVGRAAALSSRPTGGHWVIASSTRRDLPTPASPEITTILPLPPTTSSRIASSFLCSADTADQRRSAGDVARFGARGGAGRFDDLKGRDLARDVLELLRAARQRLEISRHEPMGVAADQYGPRIGEPFQTSRDIRRFADDVGDLPSIAAAHLGDDRQARMDSDPGVDLDAVAVLDVGAALLRLLNDRQRGVNGLARRLVGGVRIAEIDQNAVAHEAGDQPAGGGDRFADDPMVPAENLLRLLRVEEFGHSGRTDEIAKDDGDRATLGLEAELRRLPAPLDMRQKPQRFRMIRVERRESARPG